MLERASRALGLSAIPAVFFISAALAIVFVAFAIPFSAGFAEFFGNLTAWTTHYFGWFYVGSVTGLLGFLIWIALSRYGSIRLGRDHELPEYGTMTWFAMLFAAGIGTILMFWGVAEPLSHFAEPPLEGVEGRSRESGKLAMSIALYHFGLHTWTIFTLPALAIGYFAYRQGLPMRISSLFYTLLGERIHGPAGWTIDIIAVLGTLFGVGVSTGLATLQLNSGLNQLFGIAEGDAARLGIVAVITVAASISVALGLDRGIRRLSEFNIVIALAILLFVWLTGPTLFVTEGIVENVGHYLDNLPWLAFWTETFQGTDWQSDWTAFYWAWTISWAPYVGIFIARISRGRTVRQFVVGALGLPLIFTVIWYSVFGMTAIHMELEQGINLSQWVPGSVPKALFAFLAELPLTTLTSVASLVIITVFLVTSADSAALVVDLLSRRDDQPSLTAQRVFWALLLGALAATLLLGGGLDALRNVITTLGFPFCALLIFMALALARAVHADHLGYSLKDVAAGRAPGMGLAARDE